VFGFLNYQEQRYLHDYFVPSQDLTDVELIEHRAAVTAECSSLPQCAGRALRQLRLELEAPTPVRIPAGSTRSSGKRQVVVRAIARPEINEDRFVQALLKAAWDLDDQTKAS
jgi:hypothetical protein